MYTQDTLSSQTNYQTRFRLSIGGGFCVAVGLALLGLTAMPAQGQETADPTWSQAVHFVETPALRDIVPEPLTPEAIAKFEELYEAREKNEMNTENLKPNTFMDLLPFIDPAINNFKNPYPDVVTPPIVNFDGPDADAGAALFGGRTAPPDTNGAVGPNHYVITTNLGVRIYNKTGTPLTALQTELIAGGDSQRC